MAWLCSWKCLREYDRKEAEEMKKAVILTEEQKREACEMALRGENPLPYLKKTGVKNTTTSWDTCRHWAEKNWDPDVVDELPKRFAQPIKVTAKKIDIAPENNEVKVKLVYDPSIEEEYRREQAQKEANRKAREEALKAEAEDLVIPEEDFWTFTAISNEELGEFYYDRKYKTIDWRHPAGEEISLPPEDWAKLARKIPMILKALGAET